MERFSVREVVEVPKMGLRALKLKHRNSNLTHLHVQKKGDANRVFSLAFKTDAPDKTGVPHILEHTTLCGSKKFPVRDPFFKMLNRSLANFMNAMTAFDYTYYPFATTNKTDYENLQKVYMDSVFDPLLKEQDFQQEGWRLEPAELSKGKDSPLVFKGVVYNEMKGQMSMPAYQHYMAWFMSIYPSMQYSAGDPMHIPDLKYEDLVKFHKDHYHPDNCFTFSYGDFPVEEALAPMNEYLDRQKSLNPSQATQNGAVPQPVELTETISRKELGPLDPMFDDNRQHKISLTWYVGDPSDMTHLLVWKVLSLLLTDGHASPFYQSLIDSGIGSEFSVNTGFEETPAKLMFTIGLQGIEESKIPEFKNAVFQTVENIVKEGFPQQRVDALLHQAELADREVDANYGMSVLSRVVGRAFHPNDDFMKMLDNDKLLQSLKDELEKNPRLFQEELAKSVGIARPHFEFHMAPAASFEADRTASEQRLLASRVSSMSETEIDAAITKAKDLEKATKEVQDLEVLPKVTTADISPETRRYPVTHSLLNANIPLITRETGTQGISYIRLLRDLSTIPKELVPYLLLYTDALTNVGTKSHTMAELEDLVKLNTGNLSVSAGIRSWGNAELTYGASALDSKLPQMYDLLTELSTEPRLDNLAKLKVIIDSSAANITNSLSQSGQRYAVSRAAAALSPRKAADDQLSGFSFVKLIQQLSAQTEEQLQESLVPKLEKIHTLPWSFRAMGVTHSPVTSVHEEHLLNLNNLAGAVGASASAPAPTVRGLQSPDIQQKLQESWQLGPKNTMVELPSFQVSHVGAAVQGCKADLNDKDHAALQVLANLLTHRHLHTEIREKGGAYGGGASYNAVEGLLTMYSYRDPTPENTRAVMRNAGKWATEHRFTDNEIEEGKIGIFQSVDSPISPRSEITGHLGLQTTDEERQMRRKNLLDVTAHDLNRVAEKYLSPNLSDQSQNSLCVIGPGPKPDGWTSITL